MRRENKRASNPHVPSVIASIHGPEGETEREIGKSRVRKVGRAGVFIRPSGSLVVGAKESLSRARSESVTSPQPSGACMRDSVIFLHPDHTATKETFDAMPAAGPGGTYPGRRGSHGKGALVTR
jgi:hypothetical protein